MGKDATIKAPPAELESSSGEEDEDDGAIASVLVPSGSGWERYRLAPGARLTITGDDGEAAAIVEADDIDVDE